MATTSFSTVTLLSFGQWLDNWLAGTGQGYFNTSSRLYYQPDPRLPAGNVAYASPFRSWVCDSGVGGAIIADRVSGSLGPGGTGAITRGQSGMIVDYANGRVIFPSSVGTSAIISGSYAVKEFNVYFANQSAERQVFTTKYALNSRFNCTGIPPPYAMVTPCVFISNEVSENDNWAFGGLYNTRHDLTVYVMAETPGQLEGALSVMADAYEAHFPQLDTSTVPLGPSGDVKSGYNYGTLLAQYGTPGNVYTITDVQATKIGDGVKLDQNIWMGACSFTVERARTIH